MVRIFPTTAFCVALFLAVPTALGGAHQSVDFVLPDLEGVMHRLSDYRGRWVVVNYWATWCPPCLEEIPELELFHEEHKDTDAVVLGIDFEAIELDKLKAFVEEQFMSYPVLRQRPRGRTALGPIPGMPTTYMVSPEGVVVARQVGGITRDVLNRFLARQRQQQERARRGAE